MKRRAVCFLLCVCFCFCSLSLSSSAVDEYYYDDYGDAWLKDDDEDVLYKEPYMEMSMPSFLIASEPNFDFDPQQIPWLEAPETVQSIVYSEIPSMLDDDYVKVPFVMAVVQSSYIRVFAGYNLTLCRMFKHYPAADTERMKVRLCSFTNLGSYKYSICYMADFNRNYSVKVPWRALEPSDFGSNGNVKLYTELNPNLDGTFDFYCYGANYAKSGNPSAVQVLAQPTTNDNGTKVSYYAAHFYQSSIGFESGRFILNPEDFPTYYFQSFTPKSIQQIEQETQKGIWDSIKSIPDMIGEKLKSLFIPEEGFFTSFVAEFQEYFKDRFGLIYELPDAVVGILQQFISYSPAESGYSIHFPEVVMPVLDGGEWSDRVLIEERDITFDFLEQGAFKTLYTMYRSVVWMIFVFALINLIIRKSERVFGGGG